MSEINNDRRQFMGKALAMAGIAIAPGVMLYDVKAGNDGKPASSKVRWGMLIDSNQCKEGCDDCVTACSTENGLSGGKKSTDSQWIRKVELKDMRSGRSLNLPMMCQHCEQPPCVDVCPTQASFKRADGIVLVDKHRCIGCRYCMMACPYKARSFVHEELHDQNPEVPRGKGTVESCTLCVHRVDRGESPACMEACAKAGHNAILFGDLNDPESEISKRIRTVATSQIRADLGLNPGIRYQGM
ncbi:sulfate reduction electron transfer complex DsrMKJOP subunit DsrO [Ferriphaselus sp. R-1]|uniref:sulfate reduction electron transfer complex DsrMKJOP subunit DsrO n=1 Tax=Ferriphaselus sp. R-1 TaxID=1485544 RepID=UPI0005500623|nr:4Fe-4S dicluster domain-containing protein [Ferriphaselus sp. R-1]